MYKKRQKDSANAGRLVSAETLPWPAGLRASPASLTGFVSDTVLSPQVMRFHS